MKLFPLLPRKEGNVKGAEEMKIAFPTPMNRKKKYRFLLTCFIVISICLTMGACTKPEDKNEASLRAILMYEFTAPNKEYSRVFEEALADVERDLILEPNAQQDWSKLANYSEQTYGPYLTESYYTFYVNAIAHHYHNFDPAITVSVDSIDVKQDEKRPKDYDFTVHVSYEINGKESGKGDITGYAVFHDEGKIAKISYLKDDGLHQKLRTTN